MECLEIVLPVVQAYTDQIAAVLAYNKRIDVTSVMLRGVLTACGPTLLARPR